MTSQKIIDNMNQISADYQQFKVVNDRRLDELEQKGSADAVTVNHLNQLNEQISKHEQRLQKLNAAVNRPNVAPADGAEQKSHYNNDQYKSAFCNYVRRGNESAIQSLEQKNITHHADFDSGYLITSRMSDNIERELALSSPIRREAAVTQISTDALEIINDASSLQSGWTSSVRDYNKSSDVKLSKNIIPTHEVFAQPRVTQKILDDPRIDIEDWLSRKLIDVFTHEENNAFLNGDGAGKPSGILHYASKNTHTVFKSGGGTKLSANMLIKFFYSLRSKHGAHAKFMMSREVLQQIRMLKEENSGKYLWQPSFMSNGPDTLLGAEVIEYAEMPGMKEGSMSILLADFKNAYQVVDRVGIRVLRDPYTEKPFVKYYATKKVGGGVLDDRAFKVLQLA